MKILFAFVVLIPCLFYGKTGDEEEDAKTVPVGNFVLPSSQQPSPLIGFGENIISKGDVQLFLFADSYIGENSYYTDVVPSLLYGLKDNFSLFLTVPFSPGNKSANHHSSGMEDVFLQLEYAFYSQGGPVYQNQATVVGNVTFPTGSASKNPATGWGASSFFIGATFNHMREHWFFFTSYGEIIPTFHSGSRFGNEFLYQGGFGRNFTSPKNQIYAWMVEIDGTYFEKAVNQNNHKKSSGGNTVYLTPSLWFSSPKWIVQLGAGYPIIQNLFGNQLKDYVVFDFNFAYLF